MIYTFKLQKERKIRCAKVQRGQYEGYNKGGGWGGPNVACQL